MTFYKIQNKKIPDSNIIKQNITNDLINDELISKYAAKHNITVSGSEIDNRYQLNVGVYNSHNNIPDASAGAFLVQIDKLYGMGKDEYIENLRMDILKEKVQESVGIPLTIWLNEIRKTASIENY